MGEEVCCVSEQHLNLYMLLAELAYGALALLLFGIHHHHHHFKAEVVSCFCDYRVKSKKEKKSPVALEQHQWQS